MRLAHISDPHFGTEDPSVCSALQEDLLTQCPDLIVLTGDITQRARASQFRSARAFLNGLAPLPVLALPGNHDIPLFDLFTRLIAPYSRFRRYIDPSPTPIWLGTDLAVVGVNSTRVLRHKHGSLPPEVIEEVTRELMQLRQRFKVVSLHHPLAVVCEKDHRNRVRNADEAIAQWAEAGADLFLGGHIHLPYCVAVGSDRKRAVVLQAGTSVSTRLRGGRPNSYNLIRLESNGIRQMCIEQRDHDFASGRFVPSLVTAATCTADGWKLA